MSEYISMTAAADRLGVHPMTVRRQIDRGELRGIRFGRQIRVAVADLEAAMVTVTPRATAKPAPLGFTPLDHLRLTTRTYNSLRRGGYSTVEEVAAAEPRDLADIRAFGELQQLELRNALKFWFGGAA